MKKLPIIALSLLGAATLAACGGRHYHEPVAVAPVASTVVYTTAPTYYPAGRAIISGPGAYVESAAILRPGFGRVEATTPVVFSNGTSAGMNRLTLRMEDGSFQVVDSKGPSIAVGARVEITSERYIRYPLS